MKPAWISAVAALAMTSCALPGQAAPALRLTRDLRIDAAAHDLSPISWIQVAPNGAIVVSQPQDGRLRFFDSRGAAIGTFGRAGRGPGEFADLARNQSGWLGDTLWISDFSTRRYTLVAPDRTLLRTVPFIQAISFPAPETETPRAVSIQSRFLLPGAMQLVTANLADESVWPGGKPSNQPVVRVDSTGVLKNVVVWHPGRASCMVSANTGRGSFVTAVIPFCATPMEDFATDGSRYALASIVGDGGSYRLTVLQPAGDTISSRVHAYPLVRITRAVIDSIIERRVGRQTGPAADMWRSAKYPVNYPPLARLLLGRDETVWLEKYSTSGDRNWIALDGRGTVTGVVAVPRGVHIAIASRDQIWAIETDNDGLQHIVRYRVGR